MKKIQQILSQALQQVEPPREDLQFIEKTLENFNKKLEREIKKLKIRAEIFVGGSFAKKTVIKKDKYDADLFLRFDAKYSEQEIKNLSQKLMKNFSNVELIHGSRDYFQIKMNSFFFIELVPVKKISKPEQSENITDLSYSHVQYIKKKIKSSKILDDIRLAKAFCYANNCYGAESYINGFSGYALELLIYYYGSFQKFVQRISKIKEREIIDIEKHYKNKSQVLIDLNSSKLSSPIILIDPTYKNRNALAALSKETFEKFQKICKNFIKSPSIKFFELKKTDLEKIKQNVRKNKYQFILIRVETNRQEGDIAGSKLLKFYKHLNFELERFFELKDKGFNYHNKKDAEYYFVVKPKKEILFAGPFTTDDKNVKKFKKEHKKYFVKNKKIYAKDPMLNNLKTFILSWSKKNSKRLKEMYILNLKILEFI